jgi:hypothetical protein
MREEALRQCKKCGWTGPVSKFPRQGSSDCPSWRHVCKTCYQQQVSLLQKQRAAKRKAEQGLDVDDPWRKAPVIDPMADRFRPRADRFFGGLKI